VIGGKNTYPHKPWSFLCLMIWGEWYLFVFFIFVELLSIIVSTFLSYMTTMIYLPVDPRAMRSIAAWSVVGYRRLCDKVCQWLVQVGGFFLGTPIPSTNKTYLHDIADAWLKVVLMTTTLTLYVSSVTYYWPCCDWSHRAWVHWQINHRSHIWKESW
jgi:hypothetical protein